VHCHTDHGSWGGASITIHAFAKQSQAFSAAWLKVKRIM
jgi:hypothetical protein